MRSVARRDYRGLSEILYAYASTASDNGLAFAGLSVNTSWFNTTTGIVMLLGRIGGVVPIMAIAGSLARKESRSTAGTFPTDGPPFVVLFLAVVLIVTLLQFLPSMTLGPLVEHELMIRGKTF